MQLAEGGDRWSPPSFGRMKGLDEHPAACGVYAVSGKSL
jgi:hypothetical protein